MYKTQGFHKRLQMTMSRELLCLLMLRKILEQQRQEHRMLILKQLQLLPLCNRQKEAHQGTMLPVPRKMRPGKRCCRSLRVHLLLVSITGAMMST